MDKSKKNGPKLYIAAFLVLIGLVVAIIYLYTNSANQITYNTGQKTPLVFIASQPASIMDQQFVQYVGSNYRLVYAGTQNFSSFLDYPFIIISANSSSNDSISKEVDSVLIDRGINISKFNGGFGFYFSDVWSKGQEVYILFDMNSTQTTRALNSFFNESKVYAPNAQTLNNSVITSGVDPILDGISVPNFQCPYGCLLDRFTNLQPPFNYYVNFSYAFYFSDDGFFSGGGANLPSIVGSCSPPEPGACVGVYVGAPVFLAPYGLVTPFLGLFNVNASTSIGIDRGVEGTATEGTFLVSDFSFSPSTNETVTYLFTPLKQLIKDGVRMYSTPIYPLPFFTWVYGLYPLVQVTSTLGNISGLTPTNYTNLFYPMQLTTPQQITNASGTWEFSQWSIYEEIGNNTYYQSFNYSTIPFYVQGPTQAMAIYTYEGAPPRPGSISGKVEYAYSIYNSYLNISGLGPTIPGVHVLFYNNSVLMANATSNSAGIYSTQVLPQGCYNVSIQLPPYYQDGLNIYPEYEPLCVYGNLTYNLYEFGLPSIYATSQSGSQPEMPLGQTLPLFVRLYWPDGKAATGFTIYSNASQGNVTSAVTNSSGVAVINWTADKVPGPSHIYFYSFLGHYFINSTMPINSVGLNLSTQQAQIQATNDSNVSIPINVSFPGASVASVPPSTFSANMSVSGLPSGVTATFLPNPTPFYTSLSMSLNIGRTVKAGLYELKLTAKDNGPKYWTMPMIASYNLTLNISNCYNRLGGISGEVLNFDGNPVAANITISNSSGVVDTIASNNGAFNTGYKLTPGGYNVSAYIFGQLYYSELQNVTACSMRSITLTPRGALIVNVKQNGMPVANANLSLISGGITIARWLTNSAGIYKTPYDLRSGNYTMYTSYYSANYTSLFKIYSDEVSNITVNI